MLSRLGQGTAAGAGVPARLGLLNGALVGMALALGAFGPSAWVAGGACSFLWYAGLLFGLICVVVLAGLSGGLAALLPKASLAFLFWAAGGWGVTVVLGHLPYEGSTLVAWLLDRRFWNLSLYPFSPAALVRQAMAGFFVVLALAILGLLQPHRLEGVAGACGPNRRLTGHAWFLLALPLPLLFGVGLIADNLVYQPLRRAVGLTDQVIRTARAYDGDLFALSIERGVNYNAAAGVRDLLGPGHVLSIGEIDLGAAGTVFVVAHFDNGAWVNCRIVADQVSFCWDASPAYLRGLPAFLAGQAVEGCPECKVVVDGAACASPDAWEGRFSEPPRVRHVAQQGSYVWMRAESAVGDQAVDCLLRGITSVRLVECRPAVAPAPTSSRRNGGLSRSAAPREKPFATSIAGRQELSPGTQENIAARPGRVPGLMALARQGATPEAPAGMVASARDREPPGMATPDRLDPPPTVYPPTQADVGAQVYWFRCMVCHGDRGQGLTEEWRNAWDPSHRNCWQSRCHASNHPPEGFQLPYYAPPVIGPGTLARFATLADLHGYLAAQMPWQAPGSLPPEEYWQLAAFLARANGVPVRDADLNTEAAARVKLARGAGAGQAPVASPVQVWHGVLGLALLAAAALLAGCIYVRCRMSGT